MKKAKLYFEIELPYLSKIYDPLKKLGSVKYVSPKKKYLWTFPIKNIKEVLAVLGKPLLFEPDDAILINNYVEKRGEEVPLTKQYGEGSISVAVSNKKPNHFRVTIVRLKKPQNIYVSFENVRALWKSIKNQPLNKKIKTPTVAKNYCKVLGIVGYNIYARADGDNFSFKYFSGDRKRYLIWYAAIKVLVHYGVVEHTCEASKSGVIRLKENWELQTELGDV